jgi:hypothetical protein
MNFLFDTMRQTRKNILGLVEGMSPEDLNKIPSGFNNNLIWHLGHVLVTQQLLTYGRCNLPFLIRDHWVPLYRKGTKPGEFVPLEEIELIQKGIPLMVDELIEDYYGKRFGKAFQPYETSYGLKLNTIEEAIRFNNVHEAMHLGYMMSQRRSL